LRPAVRLVYDGKPCATHLNPEATSVSSFCVLTRST
jgi:hypothetical protein